MLQPWRPARFVEHDVAASKPCINSMNLLFVGVQYNLGHYSYRLEMVLPKAERSKRPSSTLTCDICQRNLKILTRIRFSKMYNLVLAEHYSCLIFVPLLYLGGYCTYVGHQTRHANV